MCLYVSGGSAVELAAAVRNSMLTEPSGDFVFAGDAYLKLVETAIRCMPDSVSEADRVALQDQYSGAAVCIGPGVELTKLSQMWLRQKLELNDFLRELTGDDPFLQAVPQKYEDKPRYRSDAAPRDNDWWKTAFSACQGAVQAHSFEWRCLRLSALSVASRSRACTIHVATPSTMR